MKFREIKTKKKKKNKILVCEFISNLRKKLKSIGSQVTIHANRGLGYILEAEDD